MWVRMEPLLPPLKGGARWAKAMKPHRPLAEGAISRYRMGTAWRDLPSEFGA